MIELLNIALLEVNARRRVETIADDMRDARRQELEAGRGRHVPAASRSWDTEPVAWPAAGSH